jgi:hypothetical protein
MHWAELDQELVTAWHLSRRGEGDSHAHETHSRYRTPRRWGTHLSSPRRPPASLQVSTPGDLLHRFASPLLIAIDVPDRIR